MYKIKYLYGSEKEFESLVGANLEGADLRGADLKGAYLEGSYLRGANLRGADLEGAYLYGAYLYGANLKGANLKGANLKGANLHNQPRIFSFQLGQDFGWFDRETEFVTIGCETHSLEYWLENYEKIGKAANYTENEINRYGHQLRMLKCIQEEENK